MKKLIIYGMLALSLICQGCAKAPEEAVEETSTAVFPVSLGFSQPEGVK